MPTVKLIPSSYYVSSSYLSLTDETNMYSDVSSTTYATLTNTRASTSYYYFYLRGFNIDDIPANAQVSSFTVKIRGRASGAYNSAMYLSHGTTTISNATATQLPNSTTVTTRTFANGSLTWADIVGYGSDFGIRINCRRNAKNTQSYYYIYGAEIEVTYTAETIHPTSVSVSPTTASIEAGSTTQLTETVLPSNVTDKSVTWSSSNTSVATVNSSGLVTGISAGNATITVTTVDGSYTATCAVTVTPVVLTDYVQASSMEPGKSYLVVNGNTGSVYMMSNESGGSRQLVGVATTITNNKISISASTAAKCLFNCIQYTTGNSITTTLESDGKYLYCDNSTGLRFESTSSLNRFWHYNGTKFWQFKSTSSDGYTDTSSEYKYYLQVSNGNFTDNHVSTTSIEDSTLPAMYLFKEDDGSVESAIYFKSGSTTWTKATKVWVKTSATTWTEQSNLSSVFDSNTNYIAGN